VGECRKTTFGDVNFSKIGVARIDPLQGKGKSFNSLKAKSTWGKARVGSEVERWKYEVNRSRVNGADERLEHAGELVNCEGRGRKLEEGETSGREGRKLGGGF